MQLVYFQFRRFGILIPFIAILAIVAVVKVPDQVAPVWLSDGLYFSAAVLEVAALLSILTWFFVRPKEARQIWNDLSEEWVTTRDIDEFMYLKLWQWSLFFFGCGSALILVGYFR